MSALKDPNSPAMFVPLKLSKKDNALMEAHVAMVFDAETDMDEEEAKKRLDQIKFLEKFLFAKKLYLWIEYPICYAILGKKHANEILAYRSQIREYITALKKGESPGQQMLLNYGGKK